MSCLGRFNQFRVLIHLIYGLDLFVRKRYGGPVQISVCVLYAVLCLIVFGIQFNFS
jgi:hypothetical protein